MIKIFVRLWLLVFLPLFYLIFATSYNPINAVNNAFIFDRLTETYRGTFFLIEEQLKQSPRNEWPAKFEVITKDFGHEISLLPVGAKIDYHTQLGELAVGDYFFFSDSSDNDVVVKRVIDSDWFVYMMLEESENQLTLNQAKGTLSMLLRELDGKDPAHWQQTLKQIETHFGYDLSVMKISELTIPANKIAQLNGIGRTWLTNENNNTELYALLPNKQWVLKGGSIPLPGAEISVLVAVVSVFVFGVSLGIFIFVFPLWRDLSQLTKTASQFGGGYLDQRTVVGKLSVISNLSRSFNTMADRLEKMVKGQRDLTNAIAHDLRTPLSRLSFAFEMLESGDVTKQEKKRYARSIASGIDTLDHLIQQILTLSRYSRAADITHFGDFQLAQSLRDEVSQHQQENVDLILEWGCAPTLTDKALFIDQRAIVRATNNLISNALRYAAHTVRINLSIDGDNYMISVEDDGPGVPEADREQVFLPFKQLDNEQRKVSKEHGLGLAIVQQIAEWHQGTAKVSESKLGGARFEIRWPRDDVSQ